MQVVFINGYGRSGSTILEAVLATRGEVFPVGELRNIWLRGVLGYKCSCNSKILDCEFWKEVLSHVSGDEGIERFFYKMEAVRSKYDRIRYFCKIRSLIDLPDDLVWYINVYERIYQEVSRITGKKVILDSSKNPTHAAILSKSNKIDVKNIHLVRHPRAVVYSWSRKKERKESPNFEYMPIHQFYKSSALWVAMNYQAEMIGGNNLRVRYEDFIGDPEKTITKVLEFIGEKYAGTGHPVKFHTIGGNPVKFDKEFTDIKPDVAWRKRQSKVDAVLTWAMTFWMAKRYGYSYDG